jgi:capsular polysaccharide biosynthesis protein
VSTDLPVPVSSGHVDHNEERDAIQVADLAAQVDALDATIGAVMRIRVELLPFGEQSVSLSGAAEMSQVAAPPAFTQAALSAGSTTKTSIEMVTARIQDLAALLHALSPSPARSALDSRLQELHERILLVPN